MRIFISSPYSNGDTITDPAILEANVNRSIDMAEALAQRGHASFVPLLFHYWHKLYPHDHDFWMQQCLAWLSVSDAMLRLDGHSAGASIEERAAKEIGMMVYYSIDDVPDNGKE